jgi:hypothetical protein
MPEKLGSVLRQMRESRDREWYDMLYSLCLFLAGDYAAQSRFYRELSSGVVWTERSEYEIPWYPEIMPGLGETGLQNHGLVNSRINVQGINLAPALEFLHEDPVIRELAAAHIADLWESQDWSQEFYQAGMEVEAFGIGGAEGGVTDGLPNWRFVSVLNTMMDRSKRSPRDWKWVASRKFLTPEEALELYADALDEKDVEDCTVLFSPYSREQSAGRAEAATVPEWTWRSAEGMIVFLGRVADSEDQCRALVFGDDGRYRRFPLDGNLGREIGPNPYGFVNHAFWVDSWAPGKLRPTGKSETTVRLAAMLNEVEKFIVETARNGVPITAVDGSRLTRSLKTELQEAKGVDGISKLVVTSGGSIRDILTRTPPMDLAQSWLYLRAMLKEEINAATGVQDMQRGQALSGERRTKFEIESLNDAAGVQARHLKASFARFVEDVVRKTRAMSAQFEDKPRKLFLETQGTVDLSVFPIRKFSAMDLPFSVNQNALAYKSADARKDDMILELQTVHMPFIQMGVMDPRKSMARVLREFGVKDPLREMGVAEEPPVPAEEASPAA